MYNVLALARTDLCVGVQTDGAKHTSDTKGKVSVIKRIIYVNYLIPRLLPGAHLIRCMVFHQRK